MTPTEAGLLGFILGWGLKAFLVWLAKIDK